MEFPPENIKDRLADFLTGEKLRESVAVKIIIGVVLLVLAVLLFPHPELMEYNYSIGSVWFDKDLIAPFAFPVYKDLRQYEKERQEAIRLVDPVFRRHNDIQKADIDSIKSILKLLREAVNSKAYWIKLHQAEDSIRYVQILRTIPFSLSDAEWKHLQQLKDISKKETIGYLQNLEVSLVNLVSEILQVGVINRPKTRQLHAHIAIRRSTVEEIIPSDKIYDEEEAANLLATRISTMYGENNLSSIAHKTGKAVLQPNIIFDEYASEQARQIGVDNVARTIGYVQENERIVRKHDPITEEVKLKLDSFRRAKLERGIGYNNWKYWVGTIFHATIVLGLFSLYLYFFRKKIFNDNGKLMLIGLLIVMEMFFAYLSLLLNLQVPLQFLVLVPAASMLLAIIFDSRVAFYGTVTIAFLIAGMRGNDYSIALSSIVAGAFGAYTVRDIRSRTQIFRSLIFIFLGYVVSILALSFEQLESFSAILTELTYAFANAVFSAVLAYGMLIFFESVFKVSTDLTLAELSDFNHPLMVELSEKAPGTFHHSVMIGNLAEAAAEVIGANAILARVGGCYHDIGKTLKPEYFGENQVGPHSRHNRLKPRMSALIIASHVKEGVELGRERGLPENVLDFIPQHHGTTRMSFFYDKALKQAAKRPTKDAIQEEDFLYPGPKPQTKETGIVMLADSVEAATRSLSDMTPQKLESAIDNMIKHRFMEGQLDECELTLRDLTKIREAFLKILIGAYHQRIKYPEQEVEAIAISPASVDQTQSPPPAEQQVEAIVEERVQPQEISQPVSAQSIPAQDSVSQPPIQNQ